MKERLSNGTTINLNTATQAELQDMLRHADARVVEAQTDRFIIEDHLSRRFGKAGLVLVRLDDYRKGRSEREYDLDVTTDDFDPKPAA